MLYPENFALYNYHPRFRFYLCDHFRAYRDYLCVCHEVQRISGLTCAEGIRRLGGVNRVMILQKLHLCEILDGGLSPECTPLRLPTPPLCNPRFLSLWKRAIVLVQPSLVVPVTARSFSASRRSPSMLFFTIQSRCESG